MRKVNPFISIKIFPLVLLVACITASGEEKKIIKVPPPFPQMAFFHKEPSPLCDAIFQFAKKRFDSKDPYLENPSEKMIPPQGTDFLLGNMGGEWKINDSLFKTIDLSNGQPFDYPPFIYWQNISQNGFRLVVFAESFGFRGHVYSVYALEEDLTEEALLREGESQDSLESAKTLVSTKGICLMPEAWAPPLLFKSQDKGEIIIIEFGSELYNKRKHQQNKNAWGVSIFSGKSFEKGKLFPLDAAIIFYGDFLNVLPNPLKHLYRHLTLILGRNSHLSGTMQPVDKLHAKAQHVWCLLTFRPHAVENISPYNQRDIVERGLKKWGEQSLRNKKVYDDMMHLYPKAKEVLAAYYETQFDATPQQAKALSQKNLDIAFRSFFIFSKRD